MLQRGGFKPARVATALSPRSEHGLFLAQGRDSRVRRLAPQGFASDGIKMNYTLAWFERKLGPLQPEDKRRHR